MFFRPSLRILRRIIASVLVFALIGYGITWAFAGHALELFADAESGVYVHAQTAHDDDDSACDHCGHTTAHMVALTSPCPASFPPRAERFGGAFASVAATLADAPPVKPPRS